MAVPRFFISSVFIRTIVTVLSLLTAIACDKEHLEIEKDIDIPQDPPQVTITQDLAEVVEYAPEKLYKLSSFGARGFSSQGMDIYNDSIMFQAGCSGNSMYIHILDLEKHTTLATIQFSSPDGKESHMNNINCGPKYRESDIFPLLYLSQTGNSRYCYVLRINNDASAYDLIQTIRYEGSKYHTGGSPYDWCIDTSDSYIYTYGYYKGNIVNREMVKFPMPKPDKKEIIFNDTDAIESLIIENISIYQGSKIINGLLYAPIGYGNNEYPGRLLTIDLEKKAIVRNGALNCGEPESLGIYKDGVIICGGGSNPYYYFVKP